MSKKDSLDQTFNPAEHEERIELLLDKLHADAFDEQEAVETEKRRIQRMVASIQAKALRTDVPKAKVESV